MTRSYASDAAMHAAADVVVAALRQDREGMRRARIAFIDSTEAVLALRDYAVGALQRGTAIRSTTRAKPYDQFADIVIALTMPRRDVTLDATAVLVGEDASSTRSRLVTLEAGGWIGRREEGYWLTELASGSCGDS